MNGMTIGLMLVIFVLTIFGLVSSIMLFNEYRGQDKQNSTEYKYSIGSMVIFILALVGVLVGGAFAFSSRGASANAPVAQGVSSSNMKNGYVSRAEVKSNTIGAVEKLANTLKAAS